jgi:uncharacterized protein YcbX
MIVDHKGNFVTQRQLPKLALFSTQLTETHLILRFGDDHFPIHLTTLPNEETPVVVWNSSLIALDEGTDVAHWMQDKIGLFRNHPLRLVRFKPTEVREVTSKYLRQDEHQHYYQFADAFPFLITTEQSLSYLNDILVGDGQQTVAMNRFRPNIVLDKLDKPFSELFCQDIASENKSIHLAIRKPCERCPVVTVDQATGERTNPKEPLTTLRHLNPLEEAGAYFGGNGILVNGERETISVGDTWQTY